MYTSIYRYNKEQHYIDSYGFNYEDVSYGEARRLRKEAIDEVNTIIKGRILEIKKKYINSDNSTKAAAEIEKARKDGLAMIRKIEDEYGRNADTAGMASKVGFYAKEAAKTLGVGILGAIGGGVVGMGSGYIIGRTASNAINKGGSKIGDYIKKEISNKEAGKAIKEGISSFSNTIGKGVKGASTILGVPYGAVAGAHLAPGYYLYSKYRDRARADF